MFNKRGLSLATMAITLLTLTMPQAAASFISSLGTTEKNFTIDYNDAASGADHIELRFGNALGMELAYDLANGWFELSSDLTIAGETFTLNSDNTAGSVSISFGPSLGKSLTYDTSWNRFVFNDTLRVEGNHSSVGNAYYALDHQAASSDGTMFLGREGTLWESLKWDEALSSFVLSDDLTLEGVARDLTLESLATEGTCTPNERGQLYFDTTHSGAKLCVGHAWRLLSSAAESMKLLPSDFNIYEGSLGSELLVYGGSWAFDDMGEYPRTLLDGDGVVVMKEIPAGMSATNTHIYANQNVTVNIYECFINTGDCNSKGSGTANSVINHTDVESTSMNYLVIFIEEVAGVENSIQGGYVTLSNY